jgi:LPS sulfotransferase NodH
VVIVSPPRSGSTLLFETLARSPSLCTIGGESHALIEGIEELTPAAHRWESNRLGVDDATPAVIEGLRRAFGSALRRRDGGPPVAGQRMLEKTPKNALRIPFFAELFPDALFILLWRDPRENLASIIEAWRSGRWTTYRSLEGWDGPWSLLLPPGWRSLRGRPPEEVAAYQWDCTNRVALDDLAALSRERWTSVAYEELLRDPAATVRRLCNFAGIEFDSALAARVAAPLPLSRYTQTPPKQDKWRLHESEILRVLPTVEETHRRLAAL